MALTLSVSDESYLFYASYDQVMRLLQAVRNEYDPDVLKVTYPYARCVAVATEKLANHVLASAPRGREIYLNNLDEMSKAAATHFANIIDIT